MESLRNSKINTFDSIKDDIKDEERNLDAIHNKVKEVKNNTENMDKLTTISNNFKIINS